MARTIKYKTSKSGLYTTKCPNGFTTFIGNRPKMVGQDCLFCKYRINIDVDNQVVKCSYGKKDKA